MGEPSSNCKVQCPKKVHNVGKSLFGMFTGLRQIHFAFLGSTFLPVMVVFLLEVVFASHAEKGNQFV